MNRSERLVGLLAARRPEPTMTVARSVADVLDDHVVFEVESIDRMHLNVWQPRLAYGGGVQGFFVGHRRPGTGQPIPRRVPGRAAAQPNPGATPAHGAAARTRRNNSEARPGPPADARPAPSPGRRPLLTRRPRR